MIGRRLHEIQVITLDEGAEADEIDHRLFKKKKKKTKKTPWPVSA